MWLQVARTLNERISKYTVVTLDSCAYAGTSDVLKVQQLLAQAGEHLEVEEGGAWRVGHLVVVLAQAWCPPVRPSAFPAVTLAGAVGRKGGPW